MHVRHRVTAATVCLAVAAVVSILALGACVTGGAPATPIPTSIGPSPYVSTSTVAASPGTLASPAPVPSATATPAAASASPPPGAPVIAVTEKEFSITPSTATAPAGAVVFRINNTGAIPHNLALDVDGTHLQSPDAQPGQTITWTTTISKPGQYQLYCAIPGHREAGMVATLTVQ